MTIKDLPILDSIQAHFLNQKPLDNDFILEIQDKDYCFEARKIRVDMWKFKENRLALLMKQNKAAFMKISKEAEENFEPHVIQNAQRHLNSLLNRNNVSTSGMHVAAISWFIFQLLDVEETLKLNKWEI
jgi:hypothetical protein